jgi:hypothetical protein
MEIEKMEENKKKYKKKRIWFIKFIIATISMFVLMGLVHESGHILFCMLSGGKTLEVGYKDSCVGGVFYVYNQYPNRTSRAIGAIGGSLFECIIAFIICKIIWKTERGKIFFFGCGFSFISSCFCWGISPLIKFGDGHNFIMATNINPVLISVLGFIGMGISCIIWLFYWFTIYEIIIKNEKEGKKLNDKKNRIKNFITEK